MRYVMLRNEDTGEIKLVDNSTKLGKGRVERLCNGGYVGAGTIETDLEINMVKNGIAHKWIKQNIDMSTIIRNAITELKSIYE